MDVRIYFLLVFINLELHGVSASNPGIKLSINDEKLKDGQTATCSLTGDQLPSTSFDGKFQDYQIGVMGEIIVHGQEGPPGSLGAQGRKGPQGERGIIGLPGIPGDKGEPGILIKGQRGEIGIEGAKGPKGFFGDRGRCIPCDEPNLYEIVDNADFGTKESPAQVTCKDAPPGTASGYYYMGPKLQGFEVYCDMIERYTCLKNFKPTSKHEIGEGKFWLSETGLDIIKYFYDLKPEQIMWLQDKSTGVYQKLNYTCENEFSQNGPQLTSLLRLFSWTDVIIDAEDEQAKHMLNNIQSYKILFDGCKERTSTQGYALIELRSSKSDRLPITDIWLGENNDLYETFSIQTLEICFK